MNSEKSFLRMLQSVDAFFPIGAFTLSNGLEDYVLRDRITSSADLKAYMQGFLQIFPYNDLGLLALSYENAEEKKKILELDNLANAMKTSKEVRVGSSRMCSRYLKAREAMQDCSGILQWYQEKIKTREATGFHPIALGIYAEEIGMEEDTLLYMYAYSVLSAIVNNAVKLVPLSQMEGQRILFESMESLEQVVKQVRQIGPKDLGISGSAYEIHCMNHEHLYSRQYMS